MTNFLIISPVVIILLAILVALIIVAVVMYFLGKRAQKRQEEADEVMREQAQTMSFYVIDKKKMLMKDSGLPKSVLENTKSFMKNVQKLPVIKVKAGPKILSLVCAPDVFKTILPKQEVKAQVAGMYVISAKRIRGPIYEPKKNRKGADKLLDKLR